VKSVTRKERFSYKVTLIKNGSKANEDFLYRNHKEQRKNESGKPLYNSFIFVLIA